MQGNKMYGDDMIFNEDNPPHKFANEELEKIWKEHCNNNPDILRPLDIHELKKKAILFIGINPSFSKDGFKKILKGSEWESFNSSEFYRWPNENFDTERAKKIENLARDGIGYFSKFKEIAEHVAQCTEQTEQKVEWEHLDLFFVRQTSQKDFKKNIFVHKGELRPFYEKQLAVTKLLINYIEPRVIVIANALASKIYRDNNDNNDNIGEFDPSVGHHFQKIGDTQTPIFFSSMLTGQRALDNNSYERLRWHICRNFTKSKCKEARSISQPQYAPQRPKTT